MYDVTLVMNSDYHDSLHLIADDLLSNISTNVFEYRITKTKSQTFRLTLCVIVQNSRDVAALFNAVHELDTKQIILQDVEVNISTQYFFDSEDEEEKPVTKRRK